MLGDYLAKAAKESNSLLAEMITTQKDNIEKERNASRQKFSENSRQQKRSSKKQHRRGKEEFSPASISSETSAPRL